MTASFSGIWNDDIAEVLRGKLTDAGLHSKSYQAILHSLFLAGNPEALGIARAALVVPLPSEDEAELRLIYAAAELVSRDPSEWGKIWPLLEANEDLAGSFFQTIASDPLYRDLATKLHDGDVADVCIWLSERNLEHNRDDILGLVDPARELAQLWNGLINLLVLRGTPSACAALSRLVKALPQYEDLKRSLQQAEENLRRNSWEPLTPCAVIRSLAALGEPALVLSLHGIRTRGEWQKKINPELEKEGFLHEPLDYGHFRAIQLCLPWHRRRKVEWFRAEYERFASQLQERPSIIAHSFGTFIVAQALEKYSEIRFDRVIFCGSIVQRDYPWDKLLKSGQVNAVLNEYGNRDRWAKLAERFIPGMGASGALGFDSSVPGLFQRHRPLFLHSDSFYALNYAKNWLPFLNGAIPSQELGSDCTAQHNQAVADRPNKRRSRNF